MSLTRAEKRLSLAAILACAFGVGLTLSMATPLVSFMLEARGEGSVTIGLAAAVYSSAVLLLGPFVPSAMRRIGAVPALLLGSVLAALSLLLLPAVGTLVLIFLMRFVMGIGSVLNWIVSETWISTLPSERSRGRVVASYATVWGAGVAAGPLALNLVGTAGHVPFVVAAAILVAAVVPVIAARRLAPPMAERAGAAGTIAAFRAAPLAIGMGFLAGCGEIAIFSLFPLYGLRVGFGTAEAALLTSVFAAGSLVWQPPIGWLADRIDRNHLMLGLLAVAIACMTLVPASIGTRMLGWPVLFVLGGAIAGFYTLGLILIGERFADGDIASGNTGFILSYTVGMIFGPIVGGAGMALWEPHGLLAAVGGIYAVYLIAALLRPRRTAVSAGQAE